MTKKPTYEELERRIQELKQAESERKLAQEALKKRIVALTMPLDDAEQIIKTLFAISNAVNTAKKMKDLYRSIHNSLDSIIDVTNFFIAIVDSKERTLNFPYYVDTEDEDFSPITNFDANDSLTGLVVSQKRPILLKKKELEDRAGQNGVWGPLPLIWMGVPLTIKDEVIGVVAVQSYLDTNLYNKKDLQILSAVSDQMAIAIERKRMEESLQDSEQFMVSVFESIQDGICVLNPDLSIRHVNGVMKKWYSESLPLEGKKCFVCYRNSNKSCDPCPSLRCLESGKTETNVVSGRPNAAIEWIEVHSYPVRHAETGKTTGISV